VSGPRSTVGPPVSNISSPENKTFYNSEIDSVNNHPFKLRTQIYFESN